MKNNYKFFTLMHIGFLFYSFYTVIGKIASQNNFLSLKFIFFYFILIFILFIYAVIWQQVLKNIPLSYATANKAITIVWGMLWSYIFFHEEISIKKIIGAIVIITGIFLFSTTTQSKGRSNE